MENLFFSLNATVPVFLMMVLGLILHKIGWIDDEFASKILVKFGVQSLSCFALL